MASVHPLTPQDRAHLAKLAERHGLTEHVDAIVALAQPASAAMSLGPEDYTKAGATRFGGDPDLPRGARWPRRDRGPLAGAAIFIAQIELAALPIAPPGLPKDGLLSLFVQGTESAAVPVLVHAFFFPAGTPLQRRASPPNDELCDEYLLDLRPVRVTWKPSLTFGDDVRSGLSDALGDRRKSFHDLTADIDGGALGRVGGHAHDHNFHDLRLSAALEREGHPDAESVCMFESAAKLEAFLPQASDYRRRQLKKLARESAWWFENRTRVLAESERWHSVLRLESNPEMNLQINDADPIIFLAHEDDLAAGRFDRLVGRVLQG